MASQRVTGDSCVTNRPYHLRHIHYAQDSIARTLRHINDRFTMTTATNKN